MENIKKDRSGNSSLFTLIDLLKKIAEATRSKTGETDPLTLDQIDDEILSIAGEYQIYKGPTRVVPSFKSTLLETSGKALDDDITVTPIDVTIVSNSAGGNTLII